MDDLQKKRNFLKADFVSLSKTATDQAKGLPMPSLQEETTDEQIIDLPQLKQDITTGKTITECLLQRRSRRQLDKGMISLDELSYMLYLTQGVKRLFDRGKGYQVSIRTVPSAGARHPLETYLLINNVEGLERGIYRYLPLEHKLAYSADKGYSNEDLTEAVNGQQFIAEAAAVFLWSAIPYRTEWRYGAESAKLILLDAGHVCQNLYIAAEALGLGTCGIAAYHQQKIDDLLDLDGEEEMIVYLAPVGKV